MSHQTAISEKLPLAMQHSTTSQTTHHDGMPLYSTGPKPSGLVSHFARFLLTVLSTCQQKGTPVHRCLEPETHFGVSCRVCHQSPVCWYRVDSCSDGPLESMEVTPVDSFRPPMAWLMGFPHKKGKWRPFGLWPVANC